MYNSHKCKNTKVHKFMNTFIHLHYILLYVHTDHSRFYCLVSINVTQCTLCLSKGFFDPPQNRTNLFAWLHSNINWHGQSS